MDEVVGIHPNRPCKLNSGEALNADPSLDRPRRDLQLSSNFFDRQIFSHLHPSLVITLRLVTRIFLLCLIVSTNFFDLVRHGGTVVLSTR